jgi:hypothetical protein
VLLFPGALHVKIQEGLPFAGANLPKGIGGFSPGNPRRLLFRGGLAARVPFDEVLKAAAKRCHPIPLLCVREQQAGAVKATVGADQHRASGRHQTGDTREDSLQEVVRLQGRVLFARSQFESDAPALVTQVGGNRGVAVKALVGATDFFLPAVAVVHREGVEVQADVALVRGDRRFAQFQQAQAGFIGVLAQFSPLGIQLLAQPCAARHLANRQRFAKETILAEGFDRLKVVLAQRNQGRQALEQIRGGHVACGYRHRRAKNLINLRHFAALADQRQASAGGLLAVRFLQGKTGHVQFW